MQKQKHFVLLAGMVFAICTSACVARAQSDPHPPYDPKGVPSRKQAKDRELPPICRGAGQYNCATAESQEEPGNTPAGTDVWGRSRPRPVKGRRAGPAPRHDIFGNWQSVGLDEFGYSGGGQVFGAGSMPSDGYPEHEPPYTEEGLKAYRRNKPAFGVDAVAVADTNDQLDFCDPPGMPRNDLYRVGTLEIIQTPTQIVILYPRDKHWRVIWTDGRELPKEPDPSWDGYSTGKRVDNATFVAETNGTDERTWLDNAGRPHSNDLRVEERFHRVDEDTLELTVTIKDPKYYVKPWVAMDRLTFKALPADFAQIETRCAPSETSEYNKLIAAPAAK